MKVEIEYVDEWPEGAKSIPEYRIHGDHRYVKTDIGRDSNKVTFAFENRTDNRILASAAKGTIDNNIPVLKEAVETGKDEIIEGVENRLDAGIDGSNQRIQLKFSKEDVVMETICKFFEIKEYKKDDGKYKSGLETIYKHVEGMTYTVFITNNEYSDIIEVQMDPITDAAAKLNTLLRLLK